MGDGRLPRVSQGTASHACVDRVGDETKGAKNHSSFSDPPPHAVPSLPSLNMNLSPQLLLSHRLVFFVQVSRVMLMLVERMTEYVFEHPNAVKHIAANCTLLDEEFIEWLDA